MSLKITIEFGGGMEQIFGNKKKHEVTLEKKEEPWTLQDLVLWMKDNLLEGKPELFVLNNTLRNGIMVMVDLEDWELLDKLEYEIIDGNNIEFISTLHGG